MAPLKGKGVKIFRIALVSIVLQYVLSIAIALYPRFIDLNPNVPGTSTNTGSPQNLSNSTKTNFIIIAVLVAAFSTVQLVEKVMRIKQDRSEIIGVTFLNQYTKILTDAFAIVPDISIMNEEQIGKSQRDLLKFIAQFCKLYYEDKADLEISANLMIRREVSSYKDDSGVFNRDVFNRDVHFVDENTKNDGYMCVLEIVQSSIELAQGGIPNKFALPVHKRTNEEFFGAPKAFVENKVDIISDVQNTEVLDGLLRGHPSVIVERIKIFFRTIKYRSFASIPLVTTKGKTLGVINIQSNQPDIFGKNKKHQGEIISYLNPVILLLTALIKPPSST
jgi:hypothetical protein